MQSFLDVDWSNEHWTLIAGAPTINGMFLAKSTYGVYNALIDPPGTGYRRIRPADAAAGESRLDLHRGV